MFVDEIDIFVKGGDGGAGSGVSIPGSGISFGGVSVSLLA